MTDNNKKRFYIEVGNLIRKARKDLNLSQELVSEKVNMSRASIVNIEKGRQHPPLHLLWNFSKILEVPFGNLIPDFQISNGEINPYFEKIIKKNTEKGILNKVSSKKLNSFISQS